MHKDTDLLRENEALRDRLSRLSQASLRINESLDFDSVLQGVLDSASLLTDARYGVLTLLDDQGKVQNSLAFGLTPDEDRILWDILTGSAFCDFFKWMPGPVRLRDLQGHLRQRGLPGFQPPMTDNPALSYLAVPIRHLGDTVGAVYLAEKNKGPEFTGEDEETLLMFAAQAALVIGNARRHRDEQRARTDLETLVNTSPVGVVVVDVKRGVPMSVNREARRMVGLLKNAEAELGNLLVSLTARRMDGHEIALDPPSLSLALSIGETLRAEEVVLNSPEGKSLLALVNCTPIRSETGEVEAAIVTVQDLTPLVGLEALRAELLGIVGHELRMPLSAIKGSAATLLESGQRLDPAEVRQFHRIINDQADTMRTLVADLLDVARIQTGTLSVTLESADVTKIVDEARNQFLSGGGEHVLRIDIAAGLPPVMADRQRIVQVLSNLLSNAARSSPIESPITIEATQEALDVVIAVSDHGRGVPSELLPHVFRKFARLDDDARQEEAGGAGLGLSICKGIVESHGGRIWAESDGADRGARFVFTLPADAGNDLTLPSEPVHLARAEQVAILVVDDDPLMLRHIRKILAGAGYTSVGTAEPDDLPRLIDEHAPRLVLLDLIFPGTDGIELMKNVLGSTDIPVIFVSAYGQTETMDSAFELGAIDYVIKPFSPSELVARIGVALRDRSRSGS